jgi:hypothetical protein
MTWAETRALFGLDDVALKGLLSVKQSGSNAIERMAGIGAELPVALRSMFDSICPIADAEPRQPCFVQRLSATAAGGVEK